MYPKYELPFYCAYLFYYDTEYSIATSEKVATILGKYGMFPSKLIYADKLTENRYVKTDANTKDIFVKAYAEDDVFQVSLVSDDNENATEYWKIDWTFTFYKNSNRTGGNRFKPWNTLAIKSTHNRLNEVPEYEDFLFCAKELIEVLNPFYMYIDDAGNWVRLMHGKHRFTPGKIQEIFWGNYFGHDYYKTIGIESMFAIPAYDIQRIGDGVFFALTDHISSYNSKDVRKKRIVIKKYLKMVQMRNAVCRKNRGGQGDGSAC